MRIKLVSDLHLEFSDINIANDRDYDLLILSGDILTAQPLHDHPDIHLHAPDPGVIWKLGRKQEQAVRYRNFLQRCSDNFANVIYVAGNHEFYNGKFVAGVDYLRTVCSEYPNIHFLEQNTKIIDDVVFIGGTLWTDMNNRDPMTIHAIEGMMNDFSVITNDQRGYGRLRALDVVNRHDATLQYFRIMLSEHKDKKCVIVGHHAPSSLSISEQYKNDTLTNGGYFSNLSEFILDHPQIVLWTHGHMHQPFNYMIGGTRVVCNPRGYEGNGYSENTGWDPHIVLEI
jgi:Icc-related predicted phosphoesterase